MFRRVGAFCLYHDSQPSSELLDRMKRYRARLEAQNRRSDLAELDRAIASVQAKLDGAPEALSS